MPENWMEQIFAGINMVPVLSMCVLAFGLHMAQVVTRRVAIVIPMALGSAYGLLAGIDADPRTVLSITNAVLVHGAGATVLGRISARVLKTAWGSDNGNGHDLPPRDPGLAA